MNNVRHRDVRWCREILFWWLFDVVQIFRNTEVAVSAEVPSTDVKKESKYQPQTIFTQPSLKRNASNLWFNLVVDCWQGRLKPESVNIAYFEVECHKKRAEKDAADFSLSETFPKRTVCWGLINYGFQVQAKWAELLAWAFIFAYGPQQVGSVFRQV